MDRSPNAWRASAAYLYVLHLDASQLAWEYLRRDPLYRRTWNDTPESESRWGLVLPLDPALDAREAPPLWAGEKPGVSLIADCNDAPGFVFWSLPGAKSLSADGSGLSLTLRQIERTTRLYLHSSVSQDCSYGFLIAAGPGCNTRCRAVQELAASSDRSKPVLTRRRPTTGALNHMRMLQTLDGIASRASHREIAEVLFGSACTTDGWTADGELRARVRHWVNRARALSAGGYRQLLTRDS